jgi:hypothetical protein
VIIERHVCRRSPTDNFLESFNSNVYLSISAWPEVLKHIAEAGEFLETWCHRVDSSDLLLSTSPVEGVNDESPLLWAMPHMELGGAEIEWIYLRTSTSTLQSSCL